MNLTTRYLGLDLKNPIVHASSPLVKNIDTVKRLEDAGVGAIVMYSLFEEQINHEKNELDHFLNFGGESFAEALSYFPEPEEFHSLNAEEYLEHIRRAKQSVNVPIIGSLNGVSRGGWMQYARHIEEAGADAIELNTYYMATDPSLSSEKVEQMYIDNIKAVKDSVSVPVAMKLGPYFSAFANMAIRLDQAGADGLVLFNRFFGPEIDLETLEVTPTLELSSGYERRLPLRWIAVLSGHLKADLAATGGVRDGLDVLKMIMAGASVAMVTSVLLERGVGCIANMLGEMKRWMEEREYESIAQMKGSMSVRSVAEPAAYERANYMKALQSYR